MFFFFEIDKKYIYMSNNSNNNNNNRITTFTKIEKNSCFYICIEKIERKKKYIYI
jgi:hypothetical protein